MSDHTSLMLQPEERVLTKLRRHWLILLKDTFGTLMLGVSGFVFLIALALFGMLPDPQSPFLPLLSMFLVTWFLVIWLSLVVLWTHYYLDIWIVTTRRIIAIEQISLFNRRVTSINLDRVQEITVEHSTILQTLLHYGSITIETAGEADAYQKVSGIPRPERARTMVLEALERARLG